MDSPINQKMDGQATGRALFILYAQVLLAYFLGMAAFWWIGVESIYAHPTPFYALWAPVFSGVLTPAMVLGGTFFFFWVSMGISQGRSILRQVLGGILLVFFMVGAFLFDRGWAGQTLPLWGKTQGLVLLWQLPVVICASFFTLLFLFMLPLAPGFEPYRSSARSITLWVERVLRAALARRQGSALDALPKGANTALFLVLATGFMVLLACASAMIRNGPEGISQAFQRGPYEYIGDIGVTSSIPALFSKYTSVQAYLSLHARAAPPGPIALLWTLSYAIGREPMPMSLAVILIGSLGIIPLFFWIREIVSDRVATVACLLYAAVPSIVLFTATCTEITFMPFLFLTLLCFDRAINRCSIRYALAAGLGFFVLSLLKFTLIGVGAYFAFVGLWKLKNPDTRRNVIQTAIVMGAAALLLHVLLWMATGFDVITCFKLAKTHFDLDQYHLDIMTPRFSGWYYRFLNPLTWFYFAGIPVSVLFIRRLWSPRPETRARFLTFLLTLLALNMMYLGRGEGERSALYIFPFLVVPAADRLNDLMDRCQSLIPLAITTAFLVFQTWLTESLFYTYW